MVPWAHRDIKPVSLTCWSLFKDIASIGRPSFLGSALTSRSPSSFSFDRSPSLAPSQKANILLTDAHIPILMDFGSALPARIDIPNRQAALMQQDLAAEHCSMPFRAPELFDVSFDARLFRAER